MKRAVLVLGSLIMLSVAVLVVVMAIGISINVDEIRTRAEVAATKALGRKVSIDGHLQFELSFRPALELDGLKIANPPSWDRENFIRVDLFRAQVRILPLLRSRIHIEEIRASGIDVDLELKADGQKNWLFTGSREKTESAPPPAERGEPFSVDLVEVEAFTLEQLQVSFNDHQSDQIYDLNLNSMQGSAIADEPLEVAIDGTFQKQRYYISISGDSVRELFNPTQSWHLDASAEMAGIILNLRGKADRPLEGKGFNAIVKLKGDRLDKLAGLIGTQLPAIGAFQLAAQMKETETGYSLSKLKGTLGKTAFDGRLVVNLSGDKPVIKAQLVVPTVDAGPLLEIAGQNTQPVESTEPVISEDAGASDPTLPKLDKVAISLDLLNKMDAEIELKVEQVLNAPGDIRNASLKVVLQNGELVSPMQVMFADVDFRGNFELRNYDDKPGFKLNLRADQTDLGNLAMVFASTEGIKGHLKTIEFDLSGAGHNLRMLLEDLDMRLALDDAALSYGNVAGGRPVRFTLKQAEIELLHHQPMQINAAGTLLDEPFKLEVSGGSLNQFLTSEPWPIDLTAGGGAAVVQVNGSIGTPDDPLESNLTLNISGKRIGGLAAWLGISPTAKLAYALGGQLQLSGRRWALKSLNVRLGKTKLRGRLGWMPDDAKSLLTVMLRLENVDPKELGTIGASGQASGKNSEADGFSLDMPIMPQTVSLSDADIDIGVKRIQLRRFAVSNLSLISRIRDGWVENSPFKFTVEDVHFKGRTSLDFRGKVPEFNFKIDSSRFDIGLLLSELQIIDGMEASVGSFGLDLHVRGANLRNILTRSAFSARMRNGTWTLRDPNTNASLQIQVLDCVVGAEAGQPVIWKIDGRIKNEPVKIQIKGDRLSVLADEKIRMPIDILAEAAGVKLEMSARVELPLDPHKIDFRTLLSGERISSINNILEIDLPPYGPYELGGRFQVKRDGYHLSDLNVRVNQSQLTGAMSFNTAAKPPLLDIDLTTRKLQINDFKVGDWSPVDKARGVTEPKSSGTAAVQPETDRPEVHSLLSPELMRSLDARFDLKVQEVLSGQDVLGSGKLAAAMEKGRFFVDPLQLNIPGGSVKLAFAFEPKDTDVVLEASAKVEEFDYGILARRIKPESEMSGWLSLNVDLKSRAKDLDSIMHHANGYIDFALVPKDFEAGLFELWAVNLLAAALPEVDSEKTSVVNCGVFQFDIKDGEMKEHAIFVDTTKMQVGGKAKADFKTEKVYLAMKPKAKKPEFFSLATPIQVKGTFTDYKVGVQPGGLIGTTFRFITSPVIVPIQRIFTERAPADGKAACSAAMHRSHK